MQGVDDWLHAVLLEERHGHVDPTPVVDAPLAFHAMPGDRITQLANAAAMQKTEVMTPALDVPCRAEYIFLTAVNLGTFERSKMRESLHLFLLCGCSSKRHAKLRPLRVRWFWKTACIPSLLSKTNVNPSRNC